MKYHYIRLFLLQRAVPPLLTYSGSVEATKERQAYLIDLFSERIDFTHNKSNFVYIPIGREDLDDGPILLGRIGRLVLATENTPPESGFEETTHESWKAANVLIDTRDFSDGQKMAFQFHKDVGTPIAITTALVKHINDANPDSGWFMEANPITDSASFWEAARKYKGEITSASFIFLTPNILRMRARLNEALKEDRQEHNARKVTKTLENSDGNLELEGEDVEVSIEYISEGGGRATLKRGQKKVYDSEDERKVQEVEDDEPLNKDRRSTWRTLIAKLFG